MNEFLTFMSIVVLVCCVCAAFSGKEDMFKDQTFEDYREYLMPAPFTSNDYGTNGNF